MHPAITAPDAEGPSAALATLATYCRPYGRGMRCPLRPVLLILAGFAPLLAADIERITLGVPDRIDAGGGYLFVDYRTAAGPRTVLAGPPQRVLSAQESLGVVRIVLTPDPLTGATPVLEWHVRTHGSLRALLAGSGYPPPPLPAAAPPSTGTAVTGSGPANDGMRRLSDAEARSLDQAVPR
jgi:hypothetical protein